MKVKNMYRITFGVLAVAALVSCAGSPKAVQEHGAVTVTVEKDVPLFDSSITGYAQLSRERKSVTMRLSFSLLDWTEAEPELRDLLRGLLYSGKSPEAYAADCTAALEKEYRDAGAALLAEPEGISGASFTWRHTETIKIRYSGGALLVISKVVYSYSGGAHGMETTEWFVIDREKAGRLGLGDVLAEGAEEPLRRAAAEALKKRGLPREGFSADVLTDNFFLQR